MSVLTDWFVKRWPKIQAPPEWGIEPVEPKDRSLGVLDYFVLWFDLGIGLLVLLAGSFLVPGMGTGQAFVAILVGSAIGCFLLAIAGRIAAEIGVPTMVLLRSPLGLHGSYLPTVLNILQLVGWTIFEIVVMGHAANAISKTLVGFDAYFAWAAIFCLIAIFMGLGGPIGVIRQWLAKFAIWVVLLTSAYLTFYLLTSNNISALLNQSGNGSLPFWVGVDLVIAMPVSWLPLVADYNRFARKPSTAFWGTFIGYFLSNVWFYALGMLFILASGVTQEPKGFVTAVAMIGGWLALLILLVHETDNAWADLYSSAISVQNIAPKISQRGLIIGLGIFCFLVAILIDITQFELFLFLIGAFFVPLFGVLIADHFILQNQIDIKRLYNERTNNQRVNINSLAIIAWILGVVAYHITSPSTLSSTVAPGWGQGFPAWLTAIGGSIPAFVVAVVSYTLLGWLRKKNTAR